MIPGKYVAAIVVAFFLAATAAVGIQSFGTQTFGASVFATFQGGTGTSSPSGILYGSGGSTPLQTVGIGSNLTFSGGVLSASAGGGWPFTPSTAYGINTQSTSTAIQDTAGFIASSTSRFQNSSTTLASILTNTWFPYLATAAGTVLAVDNNGKLIATTTSSGTVTAVTGTYPIQSSGGTTPAISLAFGTTTANVWGALNTFTNSTSTFFSVLTALWIPNSSSQAPTQAGQLALDTTNDQLVIGDGSVTSVFDKRRNLTLTYSTTTAWAGTTTIPAFVIPFGFTWNTITCLTQPSGSTLDAQYQYANATAYVTVNSTMVVGSSTPGIITLTTNNTPTAQATSTISFGTPASAPTSIGCTLTGVVTAT